MFRHELRFCKIFLAETQFFLLEILLTFAHNKAPLQSWRNVGGFGYLISTIKQCKFMKKISYLTILTAIFYSCKQDDVQVASKSEAQKVNTSQSAIEQAEEAIGQQLFKKEIDFSDLSGQNVVKFRFAGYDESSIDRYLGQYDIKPITEDEKKQIMINKTPNSNLSSNNQKNQSKISFSGIAVDFVSEKLSNDIVGYALVMTPKVDIDNKNAKISWSGGCHESWMNWPEIMIVDTGMTGILTNLQFRYRWYYGWESFGEAPIGAYDHKEINVDGPWRSRLCVEGANFSVSWVDL